MDFFKFFWLQNMVPNKMYPVLISIPPSVHSAMNDLLQTMAVAGGPGAQWASSIDNLDGAEAGDAGMTGSSSSSRRSGQRMKELALSTNAIDCAALTLPTAGHRRAKLRLQVKGQHAVFVLGVCVTSSTYHILITLLCVSAANASCEDVAGSLDDPKSQGKT